LCPIEFGQNIWQPNCVHHVFPEMTQEATDIFAQATQDSAKAARISVRDATHTAAKDLLPQASQHLRHESSWNSGENEKTEEYLTKCVCPPVRSGRSVRSGPVGRSLYRRESELRPAVATITTTTTTTTTSKTPFRGVKATAGRSGISSVWRVFSFLSRRNST